MKSCVRHNRTSDGFLVSQNGSMLSCSHSWRNVGDGLCMSGFPNCSRIFDLKKLKQFSIGLRKGLYRRQIANSGVATSGIVVDGCVVHEKRFLIVIGVQCLEHDLQIVQEMLESNLCEQYRAAQNLRLRL